jgi:tetratricopeptide (TPR) repeat protein
MPTHIFIQHGMWEKVALQNMRAHQVASELWKPGDSQSDMRHSLDWGQYGFLQRGDYDKARDAIARFEEMAKMTEKSDDNWGLAVAKARYILETEEWKVQEMAEDANEAELLANGISAARKGDVKIAEEMEKKLASKLSSAEKTEGAAGGHAGHGGTPPPPTEDDLGIQVMQQEVAALRTLAQGKKDEAVELLRKAVSIEETMRPPNGAADPVKPSHELLGEVLLETGNPAEAAKMFDAALLRMPNRARSLLGAARAYAASGDRVKAQERSAKLLEIWSSHPELPGYQEARRFASTTDEN